MRILIAEDDPRFSEQLLRFLRRFEEETGNNLIIESYSSGSGLLEHYRCNADLLLLDIEMPGLDGLETAKSIRQLDPKVLIIFITNIARYAIHGYEVNALDYVLKPISYYDLSMKLKLALRILQREEEYSVLLNKSGNITRIPVSHLYYIDVYGHNFVYHTSEGDVEIRQSRTMNEVENELAPHGFVRCHSGYLVNLKYVTQVDAVSLKCNHLEIPISRYKRKNVMNAMLHYMKGGGAQE